MSESRNTPRVPGDTPPPSAFAAKRAAAPARATTGRIKETTDDHPSRSKTLPANSSTTRVPKPQKVPEKGNTLAPSGYDVEESSTTTPHREEAPSNQYLSPPMPVPDVRQSGSSFQTEPSSYYSADDNISSGGPPPPMPVPNPERKDTVERLYDSLWEAAQLSTTPPADGSAPPMPSPYVRQEAHESHHEHTTSFYNSDQQWTPHQPLGMPTDRLKRDIQSYTMPSATPGMPHANISTSTAGESSQMSDGSLDDLSEAEPGKQSAVMPISPLRVSHGAKPPSALAASAIVTKPESGSARPSYVAGQKPPISGAFTQSRPPGPTPQFTPFHSPAASNIRPEARPTATSAVAGNNTPTQPSAFQPAAAAPSKVSHGEQTSFYYDPVQKRWVPKKMDAPSPSHTESQQPVHPTPSATPSTFSSGVPAKPTGSQSNIRPQAATSEPPRPYAQEAPNPAKPTGKPPAVVTVSSQPHSSVSTSVKPPSTTNTYAEANVRPQKINSGQGKTNTVLVPQSVSTVRPTGAAPTKTSVVVHPPQQETPRPQNGTASGPAKTNILSGSQSNIRPQVAQTSQPQPTHAQVAIPAPAPKPQQHPSSSFTSVHKPDLPPTPAASKPEPSAPAPPSKPAKMTGAVPTGRHGNLSQFDTQYVNMLLALDDIPFIHNTAAGFFSWLLLAGFILFPGTFASLQNLDVPANQVSGKLIHAVTNLPLFIVAWVCCAVGATGMCWLWWRWRKNYLWAASKIFLPGLMNSLAGFISTLANIYGVQHGQYSTTSKVTIIVTGASLVIFAILFLFYTFWLIRNVKKKHDREVGKQRTGKYGEGVVDLSKRRP